MIQRIQSVYLALVALCMFSLFFTSIATFSVDGKTFIYSIFSLAEQNVKSLEFGMFPTFLLGLTITIFGLAAGTIWMFNSRIKQMKYVRLNTLLLLAFIVLDVTAFSKASELISTITGGKIENIVTNYLFGSVTPFIAIIFNILAFKSIRKDEELVRSADRIR